MPIIPYRTFKIFKSLRRASPDVHRPVRRKRGGPKIDILLRRRRLKDRQPPRPRSHPLEVLAALVLFGVSLGFLYRGYAGSATGVHPTMPVPFALVALLGIWTSRLPTAKKVPRSIPACAFMIPFLPGA